MGRLNEVDKHPDLHLPLVTALGFFFFLIFLFVLLEDERNVAPDHC